MTPSSKTPPPDTIPFRLTPAGEAAEAPPPARLPCPDCGRECLGGQWPCSDCHDARAAELAIQWLPALNRDELVALARAVAEELDRREEKPKPSTFIDRVADVARRLGFTD